MQKNGNIWSFQPKSELSIKEQATVMDLWNSEYPAKLAYHSMSDFEKYIFGLRDPLHMLIESDIGIIGWAAKFSRDETRWFAIILATTAHNQGIGSSIIAHLKREEAELNGWVIDREDMKRNGEPYRSPIGFYTKLGFELLSDQRLELPTLSAVKIRWLANTL